MNDIRRLKDQQREAHPGFDSYMECMLRSRFAGLAAFCLGFSSCYFVQKGIQTRFVYPTKWNILVSSFVAVGISYKTSADRSKSCQAAWMAAEDKHSVLKEESY